MGGREERSHGWFTIGECGSWSGNRFILIVNRIFKVVTLNTEDEKNRRQIRLDTFFFWDFKVATKLQGDYSSASSLRLTEGQSKGERLRQTQMSVPHVTSGGTKRESPASARRDTPRGKP